MSPQWGSQKWFQGLMFHELEAYISDFCFFFNSMKWSSKACKSDNFKSHNSLKLSFTNIQGLCFNFIGCESFLESNTTTFLLYVRQTWMTLVLLVISLWGVIFLKSKRILLLIWMFLQLMWKIGSFLYCIYI